MLRRCTPARMALGGNQPRRLAVPARSSCINSSLIRPNQRVTGKSDLLQRSQFTTQRRVNNRGGNLWHPNGTDANSMYDSRVRATTILSVRKGDRVVIIGDGQMSAGDVVVKENSRKVRKIGDGIVVGIAGGAADALALIERLETKLEEYPKQLLRACVELAKDWRGERMMRKLSAEVIAVDAEHSLRLDGNGNIIEASNGVISIGSGSLYATAAARALIEMKEADLPAEEIARRAMKIAADICIYTNHEFIVESLPTLAAKAGGSISSTQGEDAIMDTLDQPKPKRAARKSKKKADVDESSESE